MTRLDVALKCGFHLKSIEQFEKGTTCPRIDSLYILSMVLKCEARDLLPFALAESEDNLESVPNLLPIQSLPELVQQLP